MTAERAFLVPEGVHARRVGNEVVILDLAGGQYYALDEVGAAIWERLARGETIDEAAEHLEKVFAVARAQLVGDIERLVDELIARDLLVRRLTNDPRSS